MARLEHVLCPAVTGLSRVLDLGDLTAGEGRDYTPSDTALTQERVLGRVQLCLDLEVALVVSVTLLLVSVVLAMNRPSTNARVPFAVKEVNICVRGVGVPTQGKEVVGAPLVAAQHDEESRARMQGPAFPSIDGLADQTTGCGSSWMAVMCAGDPLAG